MGTTAARLPQARTEALLVRDLPNGELMVYDTDRHQAHALNRSAALVWRHCDGQTSVAELVVRLRAKDQVSHPADEAVVGLALERLAQARLLEGSPTRSASPVTRRQVVRQLGAGGGLALLLPVVTSLTAPTPAMAASGGGSTQCVAACRQALDSKQRECSVEHDSCRQGCEGVPACLDFCDQLFSECTNDATTAFNNCFQAC